MCERGLGGVRQRMDMYKPSKRIVAFVLAAGMILGGFGVWVLLHPASFVVQPWRAQQSVTGARFVVSLPADLAT